MYGRTKIFNDPVYGFVSVPYGILLELIDHPYFQRLRRIRQLGLAPYVYPGALHTRFHHALGALHLMQLAIGSLRQKNTAITPEEEEAACIAILLHDIGHGPFSHALEHTLIDLHHEDLSTMLMNDLNRVFDGRLTLAISIFIDQYKKRFLHQLVSGQLDMDRMDYLNRDSFFTGVSEGVIGYDRIIKMLAVHEGQLVVEEKGIYSIEKFLIARRLMYWQVYLHKTGVAAEQMLINALKRAKELAMNGVVLEVPRHLGWFLYRKPEDKYTSEEVLSHFTKLDDNDITAAVKYWADAEDKTLSFLASGLLDRRLFRLEWHQQPIATDLVEAQLTRIQAKFGDTVNAQYWVYTGEQKNRAYDGDKEQIKILFKSGKILPITECSDVPLYTQLVTKYYLCYPKQL